MTRPLGCPSVRFEVGGVAPSAGCALFSGVPDSRQEGWGFRIFGGAATCAFAMSQAR